MIIVLAQLLVQSINAVGQDSGSGEDDEETLQDLLDNGHSFSKCRGLFSIRITSIFPCVCLALSCLDSTPGPCKDERPSECHEMSPYEK